MFHQYSKREGLYEFHIFDEKVFETEEVSIALDKAAGVILCHGKPEKVDQWIAQTTEYNTFHGYPGMLNNLVVMKGKFDVDELNECLDKVGYVKTFYERFLEENDD
jgi:hypothetical protein